MDGLCEDTTMRKRRERGRKLPQVKPNQKNLVDKGRKKGKKKKKMKRKGKEKKERKKKKMKRK